MIRFSSYIFLIAACIFIPASPAVAASGAGESIAAPANGQERFADTCTASREWGGFYFDAQLNKGDRGSLKVSVDMSRTKWEVGVVEAWLATDRKASKTLPTDASTGAVVNNESSNVPAVVGASGMLFDDIRNRNVGGNRKIGTAVTGTVGMAMDQRGMQERKSRFNPDTVRWHGIFNPVDKLPCDTKLWVRYWYPEGGLKGSKAVDIGHCLCGAN